MDEKQRDEDFTAARGWQTERLRELIRRIERDGFREATQEQIDAVFTEAGHRPDRSPP